MTYYGDIALGETIDVKFTTVSTAGVPTTLAGTPVVSAYVGNGTTEITAGITLTVDFDSRTGMHNVRVVATSGNGFATATNVQLVITTGTVGGSSVVGYVIGSFSIEARSALRPTVAARTLDVTATGAAGIDWANVENPTTALNLSATNIDVDQVVASVSGAVASVTAQVTANVTAISGDTTAADNAEAFFDGTGYAGTNNVIPTVTTTTTATNVTTVNGLAANVITAASMAADASAEIADAVWDEDATGHQTQGTFGQAIGDPVADADTIWGLVNTNLNATVSSRSTQTSVDTIDGIVDSILVDTGTDIPATLGTPAGASISADIAVIESQTDDIGVAGAGLTALGDTRIANLDATVSSRLATASYTTPPTAAANADAVWDEILAGHLGAGSTGEALNAAGSAGDPWTTALPGAYGAGSAGNIIGNNLNATVSSRATPAQVNTEVDTALADYDAPTNAEMVARTLAAASYATAAGVSAVETDTQDIQSRLPAALVSGRIDSSVGAMAADVLTNTALAASAVTEIQSGLSTLTAAQVNTEVDTGLADAGLTTTVTGRIDTTISSRSTYAGGAVASVTAPVTVGTNNDKTGYALTSGERTSIATALLTLDLATITGEAARSVLNAIRALRNRVFVNAGVMTVYEEDDTTTAWTAVVTTDATADPVTQIDPS